jgi:phenylalanyl-tRNA synthetase beta chain
VVIDDEAVGTIGEIHPLIRDNYDIGARAFCAELDMEKLLAFSQATPKFKQLPKFPAMTRDLSLLCSTETTAGEISEIISASAANLESVALFDVYSDAQKIPEGKKSLSYKLIFRKKDSTLTDEETDKAVAKILKALEEKNINLR